MRPHLLTAPTSGRPVSRCQGAGCLLIGSRGPGTEQCSEMDRTKYTTLPPPGSYAAAGPALSSAASLEDCHEWPSLLT